MDILSKIDNYLIEAPKTILKQYAQKYKLMSIGYGRWKDPKGNLYVRQDYNENILELKGKVENDSQNSKSAKNDNKNNDKKIDIKFVNSIISAIKKENPKGGSLAPKNTKDLKDLIDEFADAAEEPNIFKNNRQEANYIFKELKAYYKSKD